MITFCKIVKIAELLIILVKRPICLSLVNNQNIKISTSIKFIKFNCLVCKWVYQSPQFWCLLRFLDRKLGLWCIRHYLLTFEEEMAVKNWKMPMKSPIEIIAKVFVFASLSSSVMNICNHQIAGQFLKYIFCLNTHLSNKT